MRIFWVGLFGLWVCAATAQEVDMGATLPPGSPHEYYQAVGEYFQVSKRQVVVIVKRWPHFGDLPVALFIAAKAKVSVGLIVEARRLGKDWLDIARLHKLSAADFYLPVTAVVGQPFREVYGKFAAVGQEAWPQVALKDEDVVNLVNLRFLSEHYRCSPHVVMELRAAGQPYDAIEREVAKRKKVE